MASLRACFLLLCLSALETLTRGERIQTEYGWVVGNELDVILSTGIVPVSTFYGIPYAHRPVGVLRFAPPERNPGWMGDLQCHELPNVCMQNPLGLMWMTHPLWRKFDEDCLTLNIYKPRDRIEPLPVLVWFHGGGYTGGGSVQYPGHFMAARGTIVVTVNYRLGVFGFASTRNDTIEGNMGMLDQIMALEFVRNNIVNFGGDRNRVTIYGQSAGASSAALHMVSPKSVGLFHQAILESGSENNVWTLNYPPQDPDSYIFQVADKLNCTYSNEAEMVQCLRAASARDLREADSITCTPGFFCQGFAPIVDGPFGFMPDLPMKLREQLGDATVPIISGTCKDDGSLYTIYFVPEANEGGFTREEFQYYLRTRLLDLFKENSESEIIYENTYAAVDWFYTPWPYIDNLEANRQAINKLLTDAAFIYPWDRNAKWNAAYERNTYTYVQSFLSPNSTSFIPEWMGVPHNGELPYVWGYGYLLDNPAVRVDSEITFDIVGWVPDDMVYADYVQTLWSNFAKYSNPTPTPIRAPFNDTPTSWPRYSLEDNLKVLNLDAEIQIKENYRQTESYFFTYYMEYVTKHDLKKRSTKATAPAAPRQKFQMTSKMFQDAITKQVYEKVASRLPQLSHLSFDEFVEQYGNL